MERFNQSLDDMSSHTVATPDSSDYILRQTFSVFPDDLEMLRREGLAYFHYHVVKTPATAIKNGDLDAMTQAGILHVEPITYEDFLPISAAGIFRSNLSSTSTNNKSANSDQDAFEQGLECAVQSEFQVYEAMQKESILKCWRELGLTP
jgi:uncharacterized glyoxalase superfamily metalloenzyme YdcJ